LEEIAGKYSKTELYNSLYKYLRRSFAGNSYADKMVVKLTEIADELFPGLYEDCISDVMNNISDIDELLLGSQISEFYRIEYSDISKLSELFDFLNNYEEIYDNNFEQFCKRNAYNPNDLILIPITGDSMTGANIFDGDTAVLNKSLNPKPGDIVIASIKGKYFIKRYSVVNNRIVFVSENPNYQPYLAKPDDRVKIIGVVTDIMRSIRK